jgi:hypothetical protein
MSTVSLNYMSSEILSSYFHSETFQQLSRGIKGTGLIYTPGYIGFQILSPTTFTLSHSTHTQQHIT